MKVGIIGAGVAGLASAIRMAKRGYEVEVFEKNQYPGGKLSAFSVNGYRFDAGPSLFTMPQYVEELFELCEEDITTHFEYIRLPVVCHYFWEDETKVHAHSEPEAFAKEVAEKLNVSEKNLLSILESGALKYELTGRIFLEQSLHKSQTWLQKDVFKAILKLGKLDLFKSMHQVHSKYFEHPKLVQLFNRFATYNGSNPYKAPGLLSMIPHFEHKIGAFYPKKGMNSITQSIYELAKRQGVQFNFGTEVEEIIVKNKRATELQVNGESIPFDVIISNMDVFFTYKKLLPKQRHPKKILKQQKSTSALIFYWGIEKSFPELNLHNILFSNNYQQEFEHLEAGSIYEDPTVYINITKKFTSKDAPEGCENWFTMINVPFDSGQDWDKLITEARAQIISKINKSLHTDIEPLIACEAILDPRTIERKTYSHLGALYGTSSNNRMAAFLRHPNFSKKIKNLYFCGGSVHPGGGIPLCFLSARIVDQLIHSKNKTHA